MSLKSLEELVLTKKNSTIFDQDVELIFQPWVLHGRRRVYLMLKDHSVGGFDVCLGYIEDNRNRLYYYKNKSIKNQIDEKYSDFVLDFCKKRKIRIGKPIKVR